MKAGMPNIVAAVIVAMAVVYSVPRWDMFTTRIYNSSAVVLRMDRFTGRISICAPVKEDLGNYTSDLHSGWQGVELTCEPK
jgi:hypothetical protein